MTEIIFSDELPTYYLIKNMKNIELIENLEFGGEFDSEKDFEARQIFNGKRRQIMEIKLKNNVVLSKHKASEPITVLCLAGKGKFLAGEDLSEEQVLEAGTLITLEADVEHGAVAEPELRLLVTKYKED